MYIYVSLTLYHAFHPASFPHFTQSTNTQERQMPFMRGQISSVLESCSQL